MRFFSKNFEIFYRKFFKTFVIFLKKNWYFLPKIWVCIQFLAYIQCFQTQNFWHIQCFPTQNFRHGLKIAENFKSGNIAKTFRLETCQKFESGNLLNTWLKFWVWKLIESMPKILSLENFGMDSISFQTQNFSHGFSRFSRNIECMPKILSLETYWIHCENYIPKIVSLETYWMYAENFEWKHCPWWKFWVWKLSVWIQ